MRVEFGKICFVARNVVGSVNDDVSTVSAGQTSDSPSFDGFSLHRSPRLGPAVATTSLQSNVMRNYSSLSLFNAVSLFYKTDGYRCLLMHVIIRADLTFLHL